MDEDPHRLARFVEAQEGAFDAALAELEEGDKRSHWMWFIFPQLGALGRSSTAKFYGIGGEEEARAYLAHPLLGPRLLRCVETLLRHRDRSAAGILDEVDAMKLRSCATLFLKAGGGPPFQAILDAFYGGRPCGLSLAELET